MSVRVRLTRVGSKKNPIWRVVVADQRSPRDGRFIENLGHYNPQTEPSTIVIDDERLRHWIERGARPTNTVRKLMRARAAGASAPPEPKAEAEPRAEPEPQAEEAAAESG
jgi:small subunit ribosomal protein S16